MRKKKSAKGKLPKVGIVMGSESDLPTMRAASEALKYFGITHEVAVVSAHRTPDEVSRYALGARDRGMSVIIAGAGGAAHLPGMMAAHSELPVIGVPVSIGPLQGQDALLSIVQMPRGIPVATMAIGGAWNAGVLAAQILGAANPELLDQVLEYKEELRRKVLSSKLRPRLG